MTEYPDIHSFMSLMHYWTLREQLWTVKDPEAVKNICWEMISYVPQALEEQIQFNDQYRKAGKENADHFEISYHEPTEIRFVNAEPFKRFSIICEKDGNLPQAIWACQYAIRLGLTDDGTKGGMQGRLDKLLKKVETDK